MTLDGAPKWKLMGKLTDWCLVDQHGDNLAVVSKQRPLIGQPGRWYALTGPVVPEDMRFEIENLIEAKRAAESFASYPR
jgi:hypothetical protein